MDNLVKASDYAKFCYLTVSQMKREMDANGFVYCREGHKFTKGEDVVSCSVKQFTSYYEDATLIEQDVSLGEALEMAGLGEQE